MISFTILEVVCMVFVWVVVPLIWVIDSVAENNGKTGEAFMWYFIIMTTLYLIYGGFAWW